MLQPTEHSEIPQFEEGQRVQVVCRDLYGESPDTTDPHIPQGTVGTLSNVHTDPFETNKQIVDFHSLDGRYVRVFVTTWDHEDGAIFEPVDGPNDFAGLMTSLLTS